MDFLRECLYYVAQAGLKFSMLIWLSLNSKIRLSLPSKSYTYEQSFVLVSFFLFFFFKKRYLPVTQGHIHLTGVYPAPLLQP